MFRRLPHIRVRAAHLIAASVRARHDQAPRRRTLTLPRVALLLPVVAAAGLALAFRPADSTRATKPWTWTPLPASAFGSLPSLGRQSPRSSEEACAGSRSLPAAPAAVIPCPTAAVQPDATPARPSGPTHVVASGDDLWTIARRHSADLTAILQWNEGIDPYRLVAGQRILVPGGQEMKPLPQPVRVTVRKAAVPPAIPRVQNGDHIWPLLIRGIVTTRFSSAHPGIDIAAPKGTPVRAIAAGTVVWAGWKDNGGGYVVEIDHPNGMRSTYNHNSKLMVKRGDEVAQGDTIALVGSTGWSTGPHLDFRISMGGVLVDPLRFY